MSFTSSAAFVSRLRVKSGTVSSSGGRTAHVGPQPPPPPPQRCVHIVVSSSSKVFTSKINHQHIPASPGQQCLSDEQHDPP